MMTQLVILWKWLEKMLCEVLSDVGDNTVGDIVEGDGEHVG